MKKVFKSIISIILVLSLLICGTIPSFAAVEEEYICDLRIVYADDYEEAREILDESEFKDYELFDENLNASTGENGVWLAYKITTNIDDAITDMAVMTMNGGYQEGNYQEMVKQSYDEYIALGGIYLDAIEYFIEAYEAGNFLAKSAFRQLNFYAIEEDYEGERIGDIFFDGVDESALATMFMEGNSYALKNIRSLIAMGVSYNADGKTYLEKVEEEAARYTADSTIYKNEKYNELAEEIDMTIASICSLLKELAAHESELDYTDDNFTEDEIHYSEAKFVADMLRDVEYLNGKTLYQFFMEYKTNKKDYSSLYPLVAALNDGQAAMTKVSHYYDAIRYSISSLTEDVILEQLDEMEELYEEFPFDLYNGVDRSIFVGTFALTTEAYRADAYSQLNMLDDYLRLSGARDYLCNAAITGVMGGLVFTLGCMIRYQEVTTYPSLLPAMKASYARQIAKAADSVGSAKSSMFVGVNQSSVSNAQFVNDVFAQYYPAFKDSVELTFTDKLTALAKTKFDDQWTTDMIDDIADQVSKAQGKITPVSATAPVSLASVATLLAGGALMIYSAISLGLAAYNYYNPEYSDVPVALVDLVETVDGDRYIKYDVVYEAEPRDDNKYSPADLNAYEAKAWNALYFTKSYEAGKPLLADEFYLSNTNNKPKTDYAAVHGFGEVISYDLNKYNYDYEDCIYLSVKQSKNQKTAVADVPEVIGSMFGAGFLFLAGGIGVVAGVGGLLATQGIIKKKKSKSEIADELAINTENI